MYFRVDGNDTIATGHVMRCLAIAGAMRKLGEESVFIIADDYPKKMIEKHGFSTICLDTVWNKMDTETDIMIECIKRHGIKKLLVDSYFVTEQYLNNLRKYTTVIYIDDLNLMQYPVDVLVCYSNTQQTDYLKDYQNTGTQVWLGRKFTPLREEFFDCRYTLRDNPCKVLVTTGGTDRYNISVKLAEKFIKEKQKTELMIIAGRFNKNVPVLMSLQEEYPDYIHIFRKVDNMSELMQQCDIAISAGGTTLFELCACKVPTICFAFADNQLVLTEDFGNDGTMINAGDIRGDADAIVEQIYKSAINLLNDSSLRKSYSEKMSSVVDGKGSIRLAEKIIYLKEK